MEYLKLTLNARVRREVVNGRNFLVAPMTIIVPGVLPGSEGPLYYPMEEIARNYKQWDGAPIVKHHPTVNGRNVSVKYPGILQATGMGFLRDTTVANKLKTHGWFDEECTWRIDPRVYADLIAGNAVELSTGLYLDRIRAPHGANFMGRPFTHYAVNYRADHLAILPDQKGACSLQDGCGVNVYNQETPVMCERCGVFNCRNTGKPGPCKGWRGTGATRTMSPKSPSESPTSAKALADKAHAASKLATSTTQAATTRPSAYASKAAADAHNTAAATHKVAADAHKRAGDKEGADHHEHMAKGHREIASSIDRTRAMRAGGPAGDKAAAESKAVAAKATGKRDMKAGGLPKDPTKLTIGQTHEALTKLGYKLHPMSDAKAGPGHKIMYKVTRPDGVSGHVTPEKIKEFLYRKLTHNSTQERTVFKTFDDASAHLTTNCDCFKGKPELLKPLGEKAVIEMANNHKIAGLAKGGFTDDDLKMTYAFDADKMSFVGNALETTAAQAGTQVNNSAQTKSVDEWLKDAPPEIRIAVVNAAKIANRERDTLIAKLTANTSDATVKAAQVKALQGRSIEDLELMASLVPATNSQQQPAANGYAHLFPPYTGAGGGPTDTTQVANAGSGDLKGEVLIPPRMTYAPAPLSTAR